MSTRHKVIDLDFVRLVLYMDCCDSTERIYNGFAAAACYSDFTYQNAKFKKTFYDWTFGAFQTLEESNHWIRKLVREAKK